MPTYKPEIFNVTTLEQAKAIILTGDAQLSTEQRWQPLKSCSIQETAGERGAGRSGS